jgi:penicillin-binding protein-related factor A (putative recombinase)
MATWNSRGLRGSVLEELINYANQKYKDKGLALIQKIPTPITPVRFDKESRHLTLRKKVLLTISGRYREFQFVLMQRNVQWIPFPCRIFIHIR